MLKAYCNLNFRASSLDATGRLTRGDVDRILGSLADRTGYEAVKASNFDLALNGEGSDRIYDVLIPVREYELPNYRKSPDERKRDPTADRLRGILFGHVATIDDYKAVMKSRPPRKLAATFPMMARAIASHRNLIIIDGFSNMSGYKDSIMLAFLLRKLQASQFGNSMALVCATGTRIDGQIGNELIKFGYRPLSLSTFDEFYAPGGMTGQCSLMVTMRTRDSRERQQ